MRLIYSKAVNIFSYFESIFIINLKPPLLRSSLDALAMWKTVFFRDTIHKTPRTFAKNAHKFLYCPPENTLKKVCGATYSIFRAEILKTGENSFTSANVKVYNLDCLRETSTLQV